MAAQDGAVSTRETCTQITKPNQVKTNLQRCQHRPCVSGQSEFSHIRLFVWTAKHWNNMFTFTRRSRSTPCVTSASVCRRGLMWSAPWSALSSQQTRKVLWWYESTYHEHVTSSWLHLCVFTEVCLSLFVCDWPCGCLAFPSSCGQSIMRCDYSDGPRV